MRMTCLTTVLLQIAVMTLAPSSTASLAAAEFPVSIENCGVSTTYEQAPKRVFAMNQATTEIMLALGLHERMVGTAFLDDAVLPEFAEAYGTIGVHSLGYPSSEILRLSGADFVYAAYPSAFAREVAGPRDELSRLGTNSYLSPSGCRGSAWVHLGSMEMVFAEIRDIARIFGVVPRAEQLIATYRTDLAAIQSQLGSVHTPLRVFWYDSGTPPSAGACCGTPNEILRLAGAQNVFSDVQGSWGNVSWDEVVARDPDVGSPGTELEFAL